jgi:hypothetical protein
MTMLAETMLVEQDGALHRADRTWAMPDRFVRELEVSVKVDKCWPTDVDCSVREIVDE